MKTIGVFEAKTYRSRLLDEVVAGKAITSAKHGRPVARLTPLPDNRRPGIGTAIDARRTYRREHNITLGHDLMIRELIEEGRRY